MADEPTNADELYADYAVECDEHLTAAGRILLDVEGNPERLDAPLLNELFRTFHSVKGLSGMVGVRAAEQIAHHVESYLGAVRKGEKEVTPEATTLLIETVRVLEQVIDATLQRTPPPPFRPLLDQLQSLSSQTPENPPPSANPEKRDEPPSASTAGVQEKIAQALRAGHALWQVTFAPTAEASAGGVTVGTVRERLKTFGEILRAEPKVEPGRGVRFEFLVSAAADFPSQIRGEGVAVAPFQAAPEAAQLPPTGESTARPNVVRVDLGRLDDLLRAVGELVITRAKLDGTVGRTTRGLPAAVRRELDEIGQTLERQLRDLREGVMRVRLVPVRDVFARMRLVVRDLARKTGKEVDLRPTGEETEVDKYVVERLADPLLHLVRNAVGHGLETAAERVAAGKPARGRLDLRAKTAGGLVVIEVEDDGRGVDVDGVMARARSLGMASPADRAPTPADVLDLIAAPGFSTRETADHTSGRGVGMDVVRGTVEDLGGSLDLATRKGKGTLFTVRLPLTLAIAEALIVGVGDRLYAVPQTSVREVALVEAAGVVAAQGGELHRHHGKVLPLFRLGDLSGHPRPGAAFPALVVGEGEQAVMLGADRVVGLREVVVRPLSDPLLQIPGFAAATELGDGQAVLILDVAGVVQTLRGPRRAS